MTTQYNVVTYGNLTNTNGVLSGFSSDNYATIPLNFNPTQRPYEVVFKFAGTNGVIWNVGDVTTARGHIEFEVYQNKLYAEFAANETLLWSIEGVTTLSSNTDYWVKLTYNGVDTYGLYLSTDGTTWNTEGTATSSDFLGDGSTEYNLIGVQTSGGVVGYAFNGSIDLNGSYINIDNIRFWQGSTTVSNVRTRIQLRHDTAANWTSVNPILLDGEVGIETDTRKQKFGDGVTAWNSLPYDVGSTALQSITGSNVTNALGYTPVNKTGDTMTGGLIISASSPYQGLRMNDTGQVAGTTPSSDRIIGLRFYDNNGTYVSYIQNVYGTDGSRRLLLNCRNAAGTNAGTLVIGFNASNNFISELPACQDNGSIVTTVSKSKSQNGYYKLGNGLIIQWGTVSSTTGTAGQVTLPTAFTSSNYQITYGSNTNLSIGTTSQTTTNFDWKKASTNASINWIAIGY